jgi:hypothetical protein
MKYENTKESHRFQLWFPTSLASLYCKLLGKYESAAVNLVILLGKGERKSILCAVEINIMNLNEV